MRKVSVPEARSTINHLPNGIEFLIPTKKNWFLLLFLGFWMCGWLFGEISVSKILFTDDPDTAPKLFLIFWFCGWTVGGVFAITMWLWNAFGIEKITLTPQSLVIRNEIFNFGMTKEYDIQPIRDLRVSPISYNPFDISSGMKWWGYGGGLIAFDYGAKTYRFGNGVDEAEAREIINQITLKSIIKNAG